LYPFRKTIEGGLPAIMTGHLLFPAIDPIYPATISKKILTGILRDTFGFQGVIISDDLEMKGISNNFSMEEIALKAVEAGLDIFLCCHTIAEQKKLVTTLRKIVENGDEKRETIGVSIERIQKLKKNLLSSHITS